MLLIWIDSKDLKEKSLGVGVHKGTSLRGWDTNLTLWSDHLRKNNFLGYFKIISWKHQPKTYFQPPAHQFQSPQQARDIRDCSQPRDVGDEDVPSPGRAWFELRRVQLVPGCASDPFVPMDWTIVTKTCSEAAAFVPLCLNSPPAAPESTWKPESCSDFGSLHTFIPHCHVQQKSLAHCGRVLHLTSCPATEGFGFYLCLKQG